MLHYPQQILWIIKSVQALVMPVVSFPLFLLPHLPFTCFFPIDLLQPRLNARSVQLGWSCRVNTHQTITLPKAATHRPAALSKEKWNGRRGCLQEQLYHCGSDFHTGMKKRHTRLARIDPRHFILCLCLQASMTLYSGAARMTSVGLP